MSILIDPSYEILTDIPNALSNIETAARTCYKSEAANPDSNPEKTERFINGLIDRHHDAMLEHSFLSVKFITDRGVSHELVRHRLMSFAQESTRYCDYAKDYGLGKQDIIFIRPYWYSDASFNSQKVFDEYISHVESMYYYMRDSGYKPQAARAVLPNCLKTEIVVSGNYRNWRHILSLRAANTTGPAHPDMNRLMCPLLQELHERVPVIFDDVYDKMANDETAKKYMRK